MRPRLQYLAVNGQLVLVSRRPSRLHRYRWLLAGAGLLALHAVVLLGAMYLKGWQPW